MAFNVDIGEVDRSPAAAVVGTQKRNRAASARAYFAILAVLTDVAMVVARALAIGWAYHLVALGEHPFNDNLIQIGMVISLFVVLPNVMRHE
ncbi:MAG: hypothetical protein ACRCTI_10845, partial [Beijerinckiaceae bacterium]